MFSTTNTSMKINSIVNENVNLNENENDDNLDEYAIKITKDAIEKDKKENINVGDDVNKNDNFSSLLKDKVVGVNMIENDIVDDIESDLNDPHGKHKQTKRTPKPNVN